MQEHEQWLIIAQEDLVAAKVLLANEILRPLMYHCQQCAENALKGYLVCQRQPIAKTHDLTRLLELCLKFDTSFKTLYESTKHLNPFSTKLRYPTEYDIPDLADATEAIKNARRILTFVTKKINAPPTGQINIFKTDS